MIGTGKRMIAAAAIAAASLAMPALHAYPGYDTRRAAAEDGFGRGFYDPTAQDFDPAFFPLPRGRAYARGYDAPPPMRYRGRNYRAADYGPPGYARGPARYRCDRGTGGTIIGAIAGGLLGNGVSGRGDRAAGTIIGAGVGALAGRAIDRDC